MCIGRTSGLPGASYDVKSTTLGSISRFMALVCWKEQKSQLDDLSKEILL